MKAARLISDYIYHVKKIDSAIDATIGGLLNADELRLLSKTEQSEKLIFLPQLEEPKSGQVYVKSFSNSSEDSVLPVEIFSAPTLHSDIDMLSFLHRQKRGKDDAFTPNENIDDNAHANFQNWKNIIDLNPSGSYELTSSKKEDLIQSLLEIKKTEVLFVRYFFGVRKAIYPSLTLILCPVDITGRNILVLPDGSAAGWISLF